MHASWPARAAELRDLGAHTLLSGACDHAPVDLDDQPLAALSDLLDTGEIGFREAVYAVVRRIPPGEVLGYGMVGALLARPRVGRQVGYAMAALGPGTDVPWWRVIRSDGSIALQGDPTRGPQQIALLRAENIDVVGNRVDMGQARWRPQDLLQ